MALPPIYVHVHMHMHIYHRKYLTAAKQKEIAGMALQPSGEPFCKSLASNKIKRGSNVIIYGTGATVNHQGGGVANSGGLGPKGGSGGGHSAAAGRPSPRAKSKA